MHARRKLGIVKILLKLPSLDMTLADHTNCNAFQRACSKGWTQVVTAMVRSNRAFKQLTLEDLKHAEYLAKDKGYEAVAKIVFQAASAREKKNTRK